MPIEVNLCFAHDRLFEFISVQQVWYGALFITATASLFFPFAKLPWPIVLSRANGSYIAAYELCDVRVSTRARARIHTRDRDVVNVSHVSRPYVSVCVCVRVSALHVDASRSHE